MIHILLEAGRYHQIRTQRSLVGCPVKEGAKYGAKPSVVQSVRLSYIHISFPHPIMDEVLKIGS